MKSEPKKLDVNNLSKEDKAVLALIHLRELRKKLMSNKSMNDAPKDLDASE